MESTAIHVRDGQQDLNTSSDLFANLDANLDYDGEPIHEDRAASATEPEDDEAWTPWLSARNGPPSQRRLPVIEDMPAADDGTKSSDELLDDELEETPWLSARNGPPTPRKQPTSVVTSQGAVDGTYKRSHNHRNTNDGYGGAKKRRCIQDPLTPSSSPQWRQRYVTPERTSKPTHLEDSPLSPRWERARKALCSPSLRREQEEAAREILEKAHSTVGLNASARDKATRAKMHGFECPCCTPYYDALGLSAEERRERVNQVSRHRGFQERPRTPDGYWDIHFPTIEEQIARGLFVIRDHPPERSQKPQRRQH